MVDVSTYLEKQLNKKSSTKYVYYIQMGTFSVQHSLNMQDKEGRMTYNKVYSTSTQLVTV